VSKGPALVLPVPVLFVLPLLLGPVLPVLPVLPEHLELQLLPEQRVLFPALLFRPSGQAYILLYVTQGAY
jgi:hypothetical protein